MTSGSQPSSHHLRVLWLAAALLVAGTLAAAPADAATQIYRTVDEHGNVVFTDVPPKEGEQGEAVDLNHSNTFEPPSADRPAPEQRRTVSEWLADDEEEEDGGPVTYRSLRVASPAHDAAVRENAGNVTITAEVDPPLASGHRVQVYLDGALRESAPSPSIQLTNLDRGTHVVEVRVVDQAGNTLAASEPSTFHLQRRSVLLQPAGRRSN